MNEPTIRRAAGTAYWPAVFLLFMGVTGLIPAEFIPVSLLTPIARELGVTEGMAGQSVTAVGVFAATAVIQACFGRFRKETGRGA